MSTALEVLIGYLRNLPIDNSIDIIELQNKMGYLQTSLNSLLDQREYFYEFWKDYRTTNFCIEDIDQEKEKDYKAEVCGYVASGLSIQNIIIQKYNKKIKDLETKINIEKEKLDEYNKKIKEKERLEMAISEVENLLNPPKVYKKVYKKVIKKGIPRVEAKEESKKESKLCSHNIITSDGWSSYCEDCGKVLYTTS